MKDFKILALIALILIGLGFEGLSHFQIQKRPHQSELSKAGALFALYPESTQPIRQKNVRRPVSKNIQKIHAPSGVKFDLKAAVAGYQKEHGLELTKDGVKKRQDLLKADKNKKAKKKKKKNSKYEYVFDMKRGRWVKRLKLSDEQKAELLAKKQADQSNKLKEKYSDLGDDNGESQESYTFGGKQASVKKELTNSPNEPKKNAGRSEAEWTDLLTHSPNSSAIQEFIAAHNNGSVSDNFFYSIADNLAENPNVQMKEESFSLAESAVSARSFRLLVQLTNDSADATLSQKAAAVLDSAYTTLSGVHVLAKVFSTFKDNEQVLVAATQKLNTSIQKLLGSPNEGPSHSSTFTQFVSILHDLTQMGGEVSIQATRTLALLQSSLDPQTVASLDHDTDT